MALAECACGAQGRRGAPANLELWQPFLLVQPAPWLAPKELLCHRVQGHELLPSGDLSPRASTSGPWRPGCLTAGTRRCTHRHLRSCPCPRRPCCLLPSTGLRLPPTLPSTGLPLPPTLPTTGLPPPPCTTPLLRPRRRMPPRRRGTRHGKNLAAEDNALVLRLTPESYRRLMGHCQTFRTFQFFIFRKYYLDHYLKSSKSSKSQNSQTSSWPQRI